MEQQNIYKIFIPIILTQSSQRREEQSVTTKFYVYLRFLAYMFFLISIMKINLREVSGFLITYSPLRLCVMNSFDLVIDFGNLDLSVNKWRKGDGCV